MQGETFPVGWFGISAWPGALIEFQGNLLPRWVTFRPSARVQWDFSVHLRCCLRFKAFLRLLGTNPKTPFLEGFSQAAESSLPHTSLRSSRPALLHLHFGHHGDAQGCHRGAQQVRTWGGPSLSPCFSRRKPQIFTRLVSLACAVFFQVLSHRCLRLLRLQNAPGGHRLQLPPPLPLCR